jgi:riboflavin kinase/FMN adenylyltransferase
LKILSWQELAGGSHEFQERVAATIGVFDGIHIGHQKLIRAIVNNCNQATPSVLTFREHPARILRPDSPPETILSPRQKNAKFAALGVGAVILIDFSHEFSTLTGRNFVQQLRSCLDLRKIVVGYNFHFGRNRDTDTSGLAHMLEGSGIEVEVIQPAMHMNEVVSSSRLRSAIREGRFRQARAMLAADYTIDLHNEAEERRTGDTVTIPRSHLNQLMPKDGRYSACLLTDTGEIRAQVSVSSQSLSWKTNDRRTVHEIRLVEAD